MENSEKPDFNKLLMMLTILIIAVPWQGFVFMKLWQWFVVPVFNAPAIPWLYAMGLYILIVIFRGDVKRKTEPKEENDKVKFPVISMTSAGFGLLVGYIIHYIILNT